MSAAAEFNVTLHHLAPDVKQAGAEFPDVALTGVGARRLRALLDALAALAPKIAPPLVASFRISGPHGEFLVQAIGGQVRVTSWSTRGDAQNLTPERILALILGAEPERGAAVGGAGDGALWSRLPRAGKVGLLALAILGSNGVTAWLLTRPPPPLPEAILPPHRPLDAGRAQRVLAEFAGAYATGSGEGDRVLRIAADGTARWIMLGAAGKAIEEQTVRLQAAESRGHAVLVADNYGMVEPRDAITIVYFGDTYRRMR